MLNQATLDKLHALRLTGMAGAYQKQLDEPEARGFNFEERFGTFVSNYWTWRENQVAFGCPTSPEQRPTSLE